MMRFVVRPLVLAAALAAAAFGQTGGSGRVPEDPMAQPSEYGIRFTPDMARGIAKEMTRNLFVRRYELDESKVDEATELLARRFMQFAHQNEEVCQDVIEFSIAEMTDQVAKNKGRGVDAFPKAVAQGIGTRLLPIMPSIREMINGAMQDVRPMLSFKQQLKLTGEITAANIAMDAFEKNMQKWSTGEADPDGNPFQDADREPKKDEKGESAALRNARRWAESQPGKPGAEWEQYVEEAKKYYALDTSQAASVDSLLRDYQERARVLVGDVSAWQAKVYRNRLLWNMSVQLPGRWRANPVRVMLEQEYTNMQAPLETLGDELKKRIEDIPTQAQREAAEQRIRDAFTQKGLTLDQPPAKSSEGTPPASTTPAATAPAEEVAE